jgi:hypothetical protein
MRAMRKAPLRDFKFQIPDLAFNLEFEIWNPKSRSLKSRRYLSFTMLGLIFRGPARPETLHLRTVFLFLQPF